MSWPVVAAAFTVHALAVLPEQPDPVTVLGIDEIRRGRPRWLHARPAEWRAQIRYVAIDMCTIFKSAIRTALPHAQLVVDHFHLVQLANQTVTEVRRRVIVTVRGRRGRKGNREWELRNRPTRSAARMRAEHVDERL